MKKLFALVLATTMALSLASVALAADLYLNSYVGNSTDPISSVGTSPYSFKSDRDSGAMKLVSGSVSYGSTAYYPLFSDEANKEIASASDAVKSLRPNLKWEMGGTAVQTVEIVKKKFSEDHASSQNYGYFLAVTFKSNTSTAIADVSGKITLKKTSPADWAIQAFDGSHELVINYAQTVGFSRVNSYQITDTNRTFTFDDEDGQDYEFTFSKFENARFTVDVTGQDKIVLKANAKYNASVSSKYPNANLDFFNGNGASFNKIGELMIPAAEGSYLYALNDDDSLTKVNAAYDEYEEGFLIKTRTLGQYVISDMELDLATTPAPDADVAPGETPPAAVTPAAPVNPGTGACL